MQSRPLLISSVDVEIEVILQSCGLTIPCQFERLLSPVDSGRACCREEEPDTSVYIVFASTRAVRTQLGELLCARGSPCSAAASSHFNRRRAVAFDRIAIVIQTALAKDSKIELGCGIAAFCSKKQEPCGVRVTSRPAVMLRLEHVGVSSRGPARPLKRAGKM